MRRILVRIEDVASLESLTRATWRAARGKRHRAEVRAFLARLDWEIKALRTQLLSGRWEFQPAREFLVFDPKPRRIHAPSFRERVAHHALIRFVGPVLDRTLVSDSFACREGKGAVAAVRRAQHYLRRSPWFAKIDVRAYFASIHHRVLVELLSTKIKGDRVLGLCQEVLSSHSAAGRGLPIGALTSQHFANFYLAPLDRRLERHALVVASLRYMDDVIWWTRSRRSARETLREVEVFVRDRLRLSLKPPSLVQRSDRGLTFCGYKVHEDRIALTKRQKRRYRANRIRWERRWLRGEIDGNELQRGYASVLETTMWARARGWRRRELERRPAPDV